MLLETESESETKLEIGRQRDRENETETGERVAGEKHRKERQKETFMSLSH